MTSRTRGVGTGRLSVLLALLSMLMLGLALQPGTALAATVYVATTGDDSAGTGTLLNPYRSITKGVNTATAYDTITVSAGTYSVTTTAEQFPIRMKDGQKLKGAGDDSTTIRSDNTTSAVHAYSLWGLPTIDGFLITGGGGGGSGGGVYVDDTNAQILNCTIRDNSVSGNGGGIYFFYSDSAVASTTVSGNGANNGAGIWVGGSSSLTLVASGIDHNVATNSGGGVYLTMTDAIVGLNAIHDNTAAADGGGIYTDTAAPLVADNALYRNRAARGGAIFAYNATLLAYNDTIYGNTAGQGGGIYVMWASHSIFNDIIWGNGDDLAGPVTPVATFSDIENGDPGIGNFSRDPRFVNASGDDFDLSLDSPCIDTGTAFGSSPFYSGTVGAPSIDMGWRPRPRDGDGDGIAQYDVGAYEFQPNCWLGLSASNPEVAYNGKTVLRTTLDCTAGPLAGHDDVTLWRRSTSTTAYTKEATASYNPTTGTYNVTSTCTANTVFQMRHRRDATYGGASSNTTTVKSRAYLSRPTMSRYTLSRGQTFNIYSYLKPKHTGYGAQFVFYRRTRTGWKYATKKTTRAANYATYSKCLVRTRLFTRGSWRVKAVHTDANHAATNSSYRTFTVR